LVQKAVNGSASVDLRVRRTRKLLQEALIDLTVEKGFAAVSIRDICERAMVNRSTFYRHYLDKYAVLDEYLDNLETSMDDAQLTGQLIQKLPGALVVLLQHVQSASDFYRIMLGARGDARFIQRFRGIIENHMRALMNTQPADPSAPPLDFRVNYVSSADIGAILWWLESGQHWTLEELGAWMVNVGSSGLHLPAHDKG
jgi:AcrR family transcriptional regulator